MKSAKTKNITITFVFFSLISAATSSEVSARRKNRTSIENNTTKVRSEAAVAIIKKNTPESSDPKGSLACALPWGHGWGWATLPNGIWSGGESFTPKY